jgi:hypothetical protein
MEEATLFAEGPIKVTTVCVTGAGRTIALPDVSFAAVRVSRRPFWLAFGGLALLIVGFLTLIIGSGLPPPMPGIWLLILGFVILAGSAATFIAAVFQALHLQRELLLTVSGRKVSLITSTNTALLARARQAITNALSASTSRSS